MTLHMNICFEAAGSSPTLPPPSYYSLSLWDRRVGGRAPLHASSLNAAASTLAAQAVREALKQPSARKREVENLEYNHTLYVLGEGTRSHGSGLATEGASPPPPVTFERLLVCNVR